MSKILAAVSDRVDNGCRVTYDKDMETNIDLSTIYNKTTGETIKMRRDGNVWVVDAYIDIEEGDEGPIDSVFSRPE